MRQRRDEHHTAEGVAQQHGDEVADNVIGERSLPGEDDVEALGGAGDDVTESAMTSPRTPPILMRSPMLNMPPRRMRR
jgi:hypothetical protein